MKIDEKLIIRTLEEMGKREAEACESRVPEIYLYADDPSALPDEERQGLELHIETCNRCKITLSEARQSFVGEIETEAPLGLSPYHKFLKLVAEGKEKLEAFLHATIVPFLTPEYSLDRGVERRVEDIFVDDLSPRRKALYRLGDAYPCYGIMTPSKIRYRSVILLRKALEDGVVLTDNIGLKPVTRDKEMEFDFEPEFHQQDAGVNILFVMMTQKKLAIDFDEEQISLERFAQIVSGVDTPKGDKIELIEVEVIKL